MNEILVASSAFAGIRIQNASPTLTNITFKNNLQAATMDLASNPSITGVTMVNNGLNGLRLDGGTLPGDTVWDDPDIVYRLSGDVTVPVGRKLTIAPGQIVKARAFNGDDLIVNGTLVADGTAAQPIIFTSDRDDSAGGDTNNNGPTDGNNGDWNSLQFMGGSTGNVLNFVEVRFAGAGSLASVVSAAPLTLTNSLIRNSITAGLRIATSNPTLTNNGFQNCSGAAVSFVASSPK
jgi:hypothetical protein